MIETEVFKRRIFDFEKLQKFGFIRKNDVYIYERYLCEGMFAEITVTPTGQVSGKVVDEELGEEYVNHRLEGVTGAFVVGIKNAYEALLREIAEAATYEKLYIGDQTNRINDLFIEKYKVSPEFLWEKFPHFGVYRNAESKKWFAIVMNIAKGKLIPDAVGEAEVMNLKLGERCKEFLGEGIYPSYHMNHDAWVTVVLDDTLPDQKIEEMIEISYFNSFPKRKRKE